MPKKSSQIPLFAPPQPGDTERDAVERGFRYIAGIDEAGRGPLAGPVVVGCAVLSPELPIDGLADSKTLSERVRTTLNDTIRRQALAWSLVSVDAAEIDRTDILSTTLGAMAAALEKVRGEIGVDLVLVDGNQRIRTDLPQRALIGGDGLAWCVAAASILAKVERDRMMREYHRQYPQYGFDQHLGYGTAEHLAALRQYGPCPIHRRSFRGVVAR